MENRHPIILNCGKLFSLSKTVTSGQCFRWSREDSTGGYSAVVFGQAVTAVQEGEKLTVYIDSGAEEKPNSEQLLREYFDLNSDYEEMDRLILQAEPRLLKAAEFARGVHILRQEKWEALCSFIISQNNNIGRIRGIIARFCELAGEHIGGGQYAFPTPEAAASLTGEDYKNLGFGYRGDYMVSAAKMVSGGAIDLEELAKLPTEEAREQLLKIKGVGPKVAECVLLYGFGRMSCFPIDVWVKRALEELFDGDRSILECEYAGVAQQYVFEYMRLSGGFDKEKKFTASAK
ncbi:MAG: DNA-3-methyladenine glycosylase 2 family protein [Oscillospiraceae bacterium]|jgi:N-glycosylase/DNA lyase|nr:DNA-3-methyladenine glycosylase 2 family protein [Oscillospiraceae bacterium]